MSEEAPTDKDDISLERQSSSFFWTSANRSPRLNNTPCQSTPNQHTPYQQTLSTHPRSIHNVNTTNTPYVPTQYHHTLVNALSINTLLSSLTSITIFTNTSSPMPAFPINLWGGADPNLWVNVTWLVENLPRLPM